VYITFLATGYLFLSGSYAWVTTSRFVLGHVLQAREALLAVRRRSARAPQYSTACSIWCRMMVRVALAGRLCAVASMRGQFFLAEERGANGVFHGRVLSISSMAALINSCQRTRRRPSHERACLFGIRHRFTSGSRFEQFC